MQHIVIFEDGKIPKIVYGIDPLTLDQDKILVNPLLPRGIPPHRWKKSGKFIEVMPESDVLSNMPIISLAPSKPKLRLNHYLYMGLLSLLISIIMKLLLH
jgi:hypothetical protein